jgi:uncharacterized protein YgfB (UPF0149 family)
MEFVLLLPEDAEPLPVRTAALAEWCQGFLYGLGAGGIPDASRPAGRCRGDRARLRRDHACRGGSGAGRAEANESAYGELVEFVRVGVQLLFEELGSARGAAPRASAPLH